MRATDRVRFTRRDFLAASASFCLVPKPLFAQAGFLQASGPKLFLNGREFTEIGFNKYDLLEQYYRGGADKLIAKKALSDLSGHGFRAIMIMGSPFTPAGFQESFFDDDPTIQKLKREKFFAAFDELIDDCERQNILLVVVLMWSMRNLADLGRHSLHEGVTNFGSESYRKCEEYMLTVVSRYKDRPTVGLWVIGSEWNLFADLQKEEGVLDGSPDGDASYPGPLVRDVRNNFNSLELANLFSHLSARIKDIDKNHLVTTGVSEPRRNAAYLLQAALNGDPIDWTVKDDLADWAKMIELLNTGSDIWSVHFYGIPDDIDLPWYRDLSMRVYKPIVVLEMGLNWEATGADYNSSEGIKFLDGLLNGVVNTQMPLSCFWTYVERKEPFQLYYGVTDRALGMIEQANARLNGRLPMLARARHHF